jgi:hypothetical protein
MGREDRRKKERKELKIERVREGKSEEAELQKVGILGSRIPDIILEKSGHFQLRPEI